MLIHVTRPELELLKNLVQNSLERLRIRLDATDVDFNPDLMQREERLYSLFTRLSTQRSQPAIETNFENSFQPLL